MIFFSDHGGAPAADAEGNPTGGSSAPAGASAQAGESQQAGQPQAAQPGLARVVSAAIIGR